MSPRDKLNNWDKLTSSERKFYHRRTIEERAPIFLESNTEIENALSTWPYLKSYSGLFYEFKFFTNKNSLEYLSKRMVRLSKKAMTELPINIEFFQKIQSLMQDKKPIAYFVF